MQRGKYAELFNLHIYVKGATLCVYYRQAYMTRQPSLLLSFTFRTKAWCNSTCNCIIYNMATWQQGTSIITAQTVLLTVIWAPVALFRRCICFKNCGPCPSRSYNQNDQRNTQLDICMVSSVCG